MALLGSCPRASRDLRAGLRERNESAVGDGCPQFEVSAVLRTVHGWFVTELEKLRAENAALRKDLEKSQRRFVNVTEQARQWRDKFEKACANPNSDTVRVIQRLQSMVSHYKAEYQR